MGVAGRAQSCSVSVHSEGSAEVFPMGWTFPNQAEKCSSLGGGGGAGGWAGQVRGGERKSRFHLQAFSLNLRSGGVGVGVWEDVATDPGFPLSWPVILKVGLLLGPSLDGPVGLEVALLGSLSTLKSIQALQISGVCEEGSVPLMEESRCFFLSLFSRASLAKA